MQKKTSLILRYLVNTKSNENRLETGFGWIIMTERAKRRFCVKCGSTFCILYGHTLFHDRKWRRDFYILMYSKAFKQSPQGLSLLPVIVFFLFSLKSLYSTVSSLLKNFFYFVFSISLVSYTRSNRTVIWFYPIIHNELISFVFPHSLSYFLSHFSPSCTKAIWIQASTSLRLT